MMGLPPFLLDPYDPCPPIIHRTKRQEKRKCLLPGCDIEHDHNNICCSAEHYREYVRYYSNVLIKEQPLKEDDGG
jgi:hypothetical protein